MLFRRVSQKTNSIFEGYTVCCIAIFKQLSLFIKKWNGIKNSVISCIPASGGGKTPIYYWITASLANLNVILSRKLGIQLMLKIAGIENVNQIIIQSAGSPTFGRRWRRACRQHRPAFTFTPLPPRMTDKPVGNTVYQYISPTPLLNSLKHTNVNKYYNCKVITKNIYNRVNLLLYQ